MRPALNLGAEFARRTWTRAWKLTAGPTPSSRHFLCLVSRLVSSRLNPAVRLEEQIERTKLDDALGERAGGFVLYTQVRCWDEKPQWKKGQFRLRIGIRS